MSVFIFNHLHRIERKASSPRQQPIEAEPGIDVIIFHKTVMLEEQFTCRVRKISRYGQTIALLDQQERMDCEVWREVVAGLYAHFPMVDTVA